MATGHIIRVGRWLYRGWCSECRVHTSAATDYDSAVGLFIDHRYAIHQIAYLGMEDDDDLPDRTGMAPRTGPRLGHPSRGRHHREHRGADGRAG